MILTAADLQIVLTYMDWQQLIDLHGKNDTRGYSNPYIDFPAALTKKRLIVFQLNATTSESSVVFKLSDIYLAIGPQGGTAKSRNYMESIWSHYADENELRDMERVLRNTILDREFTVTPNESVSGYLVFGESYPEVGGDGLITFMLSTTDGDSGKLEMPVKFTREGINQKTDNTGIFSE